MRNFPNEATKWKKGICPNPGGRPRNRVREGLEREGKDVVAELLALLPDLSPNKRADVWLELLSYLQGKPKEVEADKLTTEELVALLEERLPPKTAA